MIALIGLYLVALAIINHDAERAKPAEMQTDRGISATNDLSVELRRCNALGPQNLGRQVSDDAHCRAVWAENCRRFFALPPKSTTRIPASQPTPSSIKPQLSKVGGATP